MADLPIDVLTSEQTKEQTQATILGICAALGLKVTSWQSGGVALVIVGVVARLFAQFSHHVTNLTKMGFLDLAVGKFLTLVAFYVYGVERIEATFASGDVVLTNTGGGQFSYLAGEFIIGRPAPNEITYRNAEPFTLKPVGSPGGTDVATVSFRCDVPGSKGTAVAGAIRRLVSTATGVTATNPEAFIGTDGERDIPLRARCRAKLATASPNGPRDAYSFVATSATNSALEPLGVTRVGILPNTGDGIVKIYLASASGGVGSDVVDAVDLLVQRSVVPDAVRAQISSATNVEVPITATIYIYARANLSSPDVKKAAVRALDDFFMLLPIGGMRIPPMTTGAVLWRAVEAQLAQIHRLVVEAKLQPETDRMLAPGEVAVPGTYTITVAQVPDN